jgi:hypothetical protein
MTHLSALARLAGRIARLASGFALLCFAFSLSGCSATQSVVDKVVDFHHDCLETGESGRSHAHEALFGPDVPERTSNAD